MSRRPASPDQLPLRLVENGDNDLERIVEARVAKRAEADALRWRFRLVVIDPVMIASLVLVAGLVLEQPTGLVLRSAALVGAGCFLTGLLMIALTGAVSRLLAKLRRPRGSSTRSRPKTPIHWRPFSAGPTKRCTPTCSAARRN